MKKTFIWIGIIVAAIAALVWWGKTASPDLNLELGILSSTDHIKGNSSSTVVVMEYSDFQCPACRTYYPVVREITAEFGDRIAFAYRHFPLITIHPNAEFAARAAEAAGKQGKFWEMHDLLFEKQTEWSAASDVSTMFDSYAALLSLDTQKFKADYLSKEVKDFVKAQRLHALRTGLQGTPTFTLNGKLIENPPSVEVFKAIVRQALQ